MSRCQDELNTIPEVAAASIKARSKRPDDAEESLAGMEIALTINRMVRSTVDPDRDQDDWCYTENTRENFEKLTNALKDNGIPPTVDFLAGESLDLGLQEEWLRSGNLIGSLTYKGRSPKKGTAQEFIDTLSRNEQELAPLHGRHGSKPGHRLAVPVLDPSYRLSPALPTPATANYPYRRGGSTLSGVSI